MLKWTDGRNSRTDMDDLRVIDFLDMALALVGIAIGVAGLALQVFGVDAVKKVCFDLFLSTFKLEAAARLRVTNFLEMLACWLRTSFWSYRKRTESAEDILNIGPTCLQWMKKKVKPNHVLGGAIVLGICTISLGIASIWLMQSASRWNRHGRS